MQCSSGPCGGGFRLGGENWSVRVGTSKQPELLFNLEKSSPSFNTYSFLSPPDNDSKKGRRPCSHWLDSSQGSSSTQLRLLHPDNRFGYPVVPRCAHLPVYNVESDFKPGTSPILPNHHPPLHNRVHHPPPHQLPLQRHLQFHQVPPKPLLQKMSQPISPQQRKVAEWQSQNASPT